MLHHAFTTPIQRDPTGLSPAERAEILAGLHALRAADPRGETKSNRGGWHSSGNLFDPAVRQFPALRDAVMAPLLRYLGEACGARGEVQLAVNVWTVINRPGGDFNVPHNHAANLLSGALYLQIPAGMQGGEIVFLDPRLNLNSHNPEGARRLGIPVPWHVTNLTVAPAEGEVLIFPSWLVHYVQPFRCPDPEAERVVISFNAAL